MDLDSKANLRKKINSWQKFSMLLSPILLISTGCTTDLSSVEQFGIGSAELETASQAFAADIYKSCIRRLDYITRVPGSDGGSANEQLRNETRKQCIAENQTVANQITLANKIPIDYMVVLGELAAKNSVDFSAKIMGIKQALKSLSIPTKKVDPVTKEPLSFTLNPTVVEAGGNVLQFILERLTGEFRKRKIKEAILCNNDNFHLYLTGRKPFVEKNNNSKLQSGLVQLVEEVFIAGYSETEREEISTFYRTEIATITKIQTDAVEQNNYLVNLKAIELLEYFRQAANADNTITESRVNNAIAYINLLEGTAITHNELYTDFLQEEDPNITPEEIQNRCPAPEDSAEKLAKKSSDPIFKMSDAEFAQFQESITNFLIQVEPLLYESNKILPIK